MSTELLLLLTVIILGALAAIGIIAFNRLVDGRPAAESEVHGTIASYGEIRRKLASETPTGAERQELAMTPTDVVALVDGLEGELNNGGFDQFFFNSTGDYALETIDALNRIGAHQTAEIVQLACDRFPHGSPPFDIGLRRNLLLESVSADADAFNDLDERFYAYEEPLQELLDAFKEKHAL